MKMRMYESRLTGGLLLDAVSTTKKSPRAALVFLSLSAACCSLASAQLAITTNFTDADPSGLFPGSTPLGTSTLPAADTVAGETIAQAENTCNQAIAQITSGITTNTPVNITINFLNDPNISLGASVGAGTFPIPYTTEYLPELTASARSTNDAKALPLWRLIRWRPAPRSRSAPLISLPLETPRMEIR
jgi:hypothetical protein